MSKQPRGDRGSGGQAVHRARTVQLPEGLDGVVGRGAQLCGPAVAENFLLAYVDFP